MKPDAVKIVTQALGLPPAARALLAEKLIESLDVDSQGDLSPEWAAEIQRRYQEIERGEVELRDFEDVMKQAAQSLP